MAAALQDLLTPPRTPPSQSPRSPTRHWWRRCLPLECIEGLPFQEELDAQPIPDWDGIPPSPYPLLRGDRPNPGTPSLNVKYTRKEEGGGGLGRRAQFSPRGRESGVRPVPAAARWPSRSTGEWEMEEGAATAAGGQNGDSGRRCTEVGL
jgi:hypothetical protein